MNSWRIRLGIIGAGVVLLLFYLFMGGELIPGSKPGILIEFGADPGEFEGLQAEIDGKVVGELKRYGQATRSGFTVSKGEHMVRVIHPRLECEPLKVEATLPGIKTMLLLEYDDSVDSKGAMKQVLRLRQ